MRPSQIPTDSALQMKGRDGKPLVLFENVFPATPSGKIELQSEIAGEALGRCGADAVMARTTAATYPLMLISPASDKRITSTLAASARSRRPGC